MAPSSKRQALEGTWPLVFQRHEGRKCRTASRACQERLRLDGVSLQLGQTSSTRPGCTLMTFPQPASLSLGSPEGCGAFRFMTRIRFPGLCGKPLPISETLPLLAHWGMQPTPEFSNPPVLVMVARSHSQPARLPELRTHSPWTAPPGRDRGKRCPFSPPGQVALFEGLVHNLLGLPVVVPPRLGKSRSSFTKLPWKKSAEERDTDGGASPGLRAILVSMRVPLPHSLCPSAQPRTPHPPHARLVHS